MNIESILDDEQIHLHHDGVVWTRPELLRWAQDGYRDLCYSSGAVNRPYLVNLPARTAASFSQLWELGVHPGTYRVFSRAMANRPSRCTYLWEVQVVEGIAPANSYEVTTQLWEEAYSGDTDTHNRVALPRQTDRPLKVYWDSKRLAHTTAKEL